MYLAPGAGHLRDRRIDPEGFRTTSTANSSPICASRRHHVVDAEGDVMSHALRPSPTCAPNVIEAEEPCRARIRRRPKISLSAPAECAHGRERRGRHH